MVDEESRSQVERLNGVLEGQPYKLAVVPIADLELLEKNARFMRSETFRNLVDNIRREGGISSVPFCWKHEGRYRVLSGNHRVMAAKEAGLSEIPVLYTDRDLSRSEQVAIQLSHNAIVGEDDPIILKELWDEIEDVSLKYFAGLDDKLMDALTPVSLDALSEVRLDYRSVSFLFLPEEVERLDKLLEEAKAEVGLRNVRLGRLAEYDRLMDALAKTQAAYNVKNMAVSLLLVLSAFERHLTDLSEGWLDEDGELKHKGKVPFASVLGQDGLPAEDAKVIKQALDRMVSRKEIESGERWRSLARWASEYLSRE